MTHPTRSPVRHEPVDVAVVGGGLIGLATAFELRRRGRSVTVIDPEPGSGASQAAAGMLAAVSEVQHQQEPLFPLMSASAAQYPDFVTTVEQVAGQPVGYRTTQTLVCGVDSADRQALTDLRQLQLHHGMTVEPLTLREARRLEPALSPRLSSVLSIPADHQVDPRRLLAGLLSALRTDDITDLCIGGAPDGGPVGLVRQRARALQRTGSGTVVGVRLEDGAVVAAAETVLATGLGAGALDDLPETWRLPLRPVHGDILHARLPAGAEPLTERTIRGLVHGVPVYLVPRADGTIVIGATSREDGLPGVSAGGVYQLLRDAQALVPGVADLELVEMMARARPGTPDDIPYLGRIRGADDVPVVGLVVSTGYFRHGVLLTPLAARLGAQLVTGETGSDPRIDVAFLATTDPHRFDRPATERTPDRHLPIPPAPTGGTPTLVPPPASALQNRST